MYLCLRSIHATPDLISIQPCLPSPMSQAQLDFFHLQFAASYSQGRNQADSLAHALGGVLGTPPFTEVSGFVSVP